MNFVNKTNQVSDTSYCFTDDDATYETEKIKREFIVEFNALSKDTTIYMQEYNKETGEVIEKPTNISERQLRWIVDMSASIYRRC